MELKTLKLIFQKRYLEKELPHTTYCEEHGLFTEAYPNEVNAQEFHKEVLKENIKSFVIYVLCPTCKALGILRICKQRI